MRIKLFIDALADCHQGNETQMEPLNCWVSRSPELVKLVFPIKMEIDRMAIIKRETTVSTTPSDLWEKLISDPNTWPDWLTPLRGFDETVSGPVRAGESYSARLGNMSAKLKVKEVVSGKKLRWAGGPPMLLMMGSGMRGTLEFTPAGDGTKVNLTMVTPMMLAPMMKMMTGLNTGDEMTKTIGKIKELGES
ncbi:MAG: SRPBCC family protein [Chloroflexi bacterium]|nr:SRPBCC family protein [Chloroflexota bacterium]